MAMLEIVGIDPGTSPTVCRAFFEPGRAPALDFWTERETSDLIKVSGKDRRECSAPLMADIFSQVRPAAVFLEQVSVRPGEGVVSAFRFGRAVGICECACLAAGFRLERVRPQAWRKALKVPEGKDGSRAFACYLVPHLAACFNRVKDHDKAEAFLLAWYGYQMLAAEQRGQP
jgi:Holliday junction resolvasome RuvABC endonuclease subunit